MYDIISYLDGWSYVPSRRIACSMFLSVGLCLRESLSRASMSKGSP